MKMKNVLALMLALCMALSLFGCGAKDDADDGYTIAMLPKLKGENYFDACKEGAEKAAAELGVTLLYDAPPSDNATNQKQVDLIEGWVAQGVDAIIVSPLDGPTLSTTLKSAMEQGVKILTYDSDANADARDLFINQASELAVAEGLMATAKKDLEAKGFSAENPANVAIISAPEVMATIHAWETHCLELMQTEEYSLMRVADEANDVIRQGDGSEASTNEIASAVLTRMGEGEDQIQLCLGLSTMATAAMAAQYEALAVQPDPSTISLVGLSTPNGVKSYIKDSGNPMNYTVLWNPIDLGYLSVVAAVQLLEGTITTSSATMEAGTLGSKEIVNQVVYLGDAAVFDIANIDEFDY